MPELQTIGLVDANAVEFFSNMYTKYKDVLQQQPSGWSALISDEISTGALRTKYPVDLTTFAGFRKWVGDRDVKDRALESFFVDSDPFERTIDIPLDEVLAAVDVGDLGAYYSMVPKLVAAAAVHKDLLVATTLQDDALEWAIDGSTFFSATHPLDPRGGIATTYSNLHTGKPLNLTNYEFARSAIAGMKSPDGRSSLGLRLTHLLVPTTLEPAALKIVKRGIIFEENTGLTAMVPLPNLWTGEAQIIVAPELDNEPLNWYALALNTPARPVIQQWRNGGSPEIRIFGDQSEYAVTHNKMRFNGKMFGNAGLAIPHTIHKFEG